MQIKKEKVKAFRRRIFTFYKKSGRDLPFRKTHDPYKITVSEIMLQQTQVARVIPFYLRWIKQLPTWRSLSKASSRQVLSLWSGLGYNRRALNLKKMAETIVNQYDGKLPTTERELLELPGIGEYTANAILIFAFNQNKVTIDTNIRRVLIHELKVTPSISLKKLQIIAEKVLPQGKSREWHNALMDFASLALPKTPRIKPLSLQTTFKGSIRQIRGIIVKMLTKKNFVTEQMISRESKRNLRNIRKALASLKKEGVIFGSKKFRLA